MQEGGESGELMKGPKKTKLFRFKPPEDKVRIAVDGAERRRSDCVVIVGKLLFEQSSSRFRKTAWLLKIGGQKSLKCHEVSGFGVWGMRVGVGGQIGRGADAGY